MMEAQGAMTKGHPVVLVIEVDQINGSSMDNQSRWAEVSITRADGSRGVVRIERKHVPEPGEPRRIRL